MTQSKKLKILIIDDEEELTAMLAMRLEGMGFEIETACNGQEGLEKIDHDVDLVLLDIVMPVMDGWETHQRLKNNPATASVPVIIFTADLSRDTDNRIKAMDVEWVLRKPYDENDLKILINEVLKDKLLKT